MLPLLFCFLLFSNQLQSKTIYLKPWHGYTLEQCFDKDDDGPYLVCRPIFDEIKNILKKQDYSFTNKLVAEPENVLFFDIGYNTTILKKHIPYLKNHKGHTTLFLWESAVVQSLNFDKKNHYYFDTIFTWNDNVVDNKKYFKLFWPQPLLAMIDEPLPFDTKKFCVMIAGQKKSDHKQELYSERNRVIEFFEQYPESGFEFFGGGKIKTNQWYKNEYKNYRGPAPEKYKRGDQIPFKITPGHYNKLLCLRDYKYCFCYENSTETGWITEKIFDCFIAGCVPIYLGPKNITDYIPENCFINRRKFSNNQQLYEFLQSLSEETYQSYIDAIKNYLQSDQALLFSAEYFKHTFLKHLMIDYDPSSIFTVGELSTIVKAEIFREKLYEDKK